MEDRYRLLALALFPRFSGFGAANAARPNMEAFARMAPAPITSSRLRFDSMSSISQTPKRLSALPELGLIGSCLVVD
jgi:hypothetical protein